MPEVQEICDRIAIIDHGRLAAIGTEVELLKTVTDVKSIIVHARFGDQPSRAILIARIEVLPGVRHCSFDETGEALVVDVALGQDDITPLMNVLIELGIHVESLNSEAPNLETTFLALTGRELR
jgi:ABC-2 type transport system ATP-binding protein